MCSAKLKSLKSRSWSNANTLKCIVSDQRAAIRKAKTKPNFDDLQAWLNAQHLKISGIYPLAQAICYALDWMKRLKPYLASGILELGNNTAERAIRAIALADLHKSVFQYQKRGQGDDAVHKRLRELANERRRFGYRRLGILLAREGWQVNHKKLFRLYREEGLVVQRRQSRKRALGTRRPILGPDQVNKRWSLDFVSDARNDGRRFRSLCVVDDHSREALAIVVDTSLSGRRVARESRCRL